jgi:hypothetical protein
MYNCDKHGLLTVSGAGVEMTQVRAVVISTIAGQNQPILDYQSRRTNNRTAQQNTTLHPHLKSPQFTMHPIYQARTL